MNATVFHPMQNQRVRGDIPEAVALRAYEVYCHVYGAQPAMVDATQGCRGGFSAEEIIAFLYARTFPQEQWARRVREALEPGGPR